MIQEQESETTTNPVVRDSKHFAQRWLDTFPEKPPIQSIYEFGSFHRTKMLTFLRDNKTFQREDFEFFNSQPVARKEDETYEFYKLRQRFISKLVKFKSEVKQLVMANFIQDFIKKEQIKKDLENETQSGDTTTTK